MMQKLLLFLLVGSTLPAWAQSLPTFDDFRRVDRARRASGQLQTAESLELSRLDLPALRAVVDKNPGDWQLQWGAAELISDWTIRRQYFESALAASATNLAVATRYALFAARQGDRDTAQRWLQHVEQVEPDNLVPWLGTMWLRGMGVTSTLTSAPPLPAAATQIRDHAPGAARARIHLLEAAEYSPFAARRLGFVPEALAPQLARELIPAASEPELGPGLIRVGRALQQSPPYLLFEFVGQSVEHAVLTRGFTGEARARVAELEERRQELKTLLTEVERGAADLATEAEMTKYFDDVLTFGEETALEWLHATVANSK